jgi:hypothetical protein
MLQVDIAAYEDFLKVIGTAAHKPEVKLNF